MADLDEAVSHEYRSCLMLWDATMQATGVSEDGGMEEVGGLMSFAAMGEHLFQVPSPLGVRLVAIDGPSGSGKSTYAVRLAAVCGAAMIEMDDLLSWGDLDGCWPRLETEVLSSLLAGRAARYRVRDWEADPFGDALNGWRDTAPADVVIIEGNTAARRAIADRLALAIWVEAPYEVRLRRGVERDGEAWRDLWIDWMRREQRFFFRDGTRTVPTSSSMERQ
jgi:hypothetical protein